MGRLAHGEAAQKCHRGRVGSDSEDYRVTTSEFPLLAKAAGNGAPQLSRGSGVDDRHGIVNTRAKPRVAAVEASANVGTVVIQDDVFSIRAADELGLGDFDCGVLEMRLTCVGDGNSPEHCRTLAW